MSKFYISVDECHYTCLTCIGPNEDNCLSCPTNASKSGNTCKCNNGYNSDENHSC